MNQRFMRAIAILCLFSAYSLAQDPHTDTPVVISVTSDPPGADVLVDSTVAGTTPLVFHRSPRTPFVLTVSAHEYYEHKRMVRPGVEDTISISVQLLQKFGFVSFDLVQQGLHLILDDSLTFNAPLDSMKISDGTHSVTVMDSSSGRVVSARFTLNPGRHSAFRASLGHSSVKPVLISLMLPGYAQFKEGAYLKAFGSAAAVGISVYLTLSTHGEYTDARSKYEATLREYDFATDEQTALQLRNAALDSYDSMNSLRKKRNVLVMVAAAAYALSLLDAALFYAVEDEIEFLPLESSFRFSPFIGMRGVGIEMKVDL